VFGSVGSESFEIRHNQRCAIWAPIADEQALVDVGTLAQELLDGLGSDVFAAAADEDVLLAVGDDEVPAGAPAPDVAGVEPALGIERLGGGIGIAPVALHDVGTARQDLPILRYADLHVVQRLAHGAQLDIVEAVDGEHWSGFGQAVALEDGDADGEEEFGNIHREGCPAGDEEAQAPAEAFAKLPEDKAVGKPQLCSRCSGETPPALPFMPCPTSDLKRPEGDALPQPRLLRQGCHHPGACAFEEPGDARHHGWAHLGEVARDGLDGFGKGDSRPGGEGAVVSGGALVGVAQWKIGQQHIRGIDRHRPQRSFDVLHDVVVGEHHPFGDSGCAAGVDERQQGIGLHGGCPFAVLLLPARQLLCGGGFQELLPLEHGHARLLAEEDEVLQVPDAGHHRAQLLPLEAVGEESGNGLTVVQDVGDLLASQCWEHRNADRSDTGNCQVCHDPFQAVLRDDPDAVPWSDSQAEQSSSAAVDQCSELGVGHRLVASGALDQESGLARSPLRLRQEPVNDL
jgi:hypothetical protein